MVPVPGPSAVLAALVVSGLPTDRFRFLGFLPRKTTARQAALDALRGAPETLVFYVGPHHLEAWLSDAVGVFGPERPAVVARELTKRFEEFRRGTLGEICADPGTVRGEIVVLIGGAPAEAAPDDEALEVVVRRLLEEGYAPGKAAREAARRTGASRDAAYRIAVAIRQG